MARRLGTRQRSFPLGRHVRSCRRVRNEDLVRCASRGSLGPGCVCLGRIPPPAARSAVVGHGSRTRPAANSDHEPARRADGPPDGFLCASISLEAFPTLSWDPRARKRARTPGTINHIRTRPPGRWDDAMKHDAGPAVKTGNPCLSPRGAGRAVGGIRAWAGNPGRRASSYSTVLPTRAFICPRPQKSSWAASRTSADAGNPHAADLSLCMGAHAASGGVVRMRPTERFAPLVWGGLRSHPRQVAQRREDRGVVDGACRDAVSGGSEVCDQRAEEEDALDARLR